MTTSVPAGGPTPRTTAGITAGLVAALAVQNAVPPFATDMYTPAMPRVQADLSTTASLVGLTLTAFFVGMALGQLVGGPTSDARGRKGVMLAGGAVCMLGALGCAFAPSIAVLVAARFVSGLGGGIASVVGRAVIVDVAKGDALARVMSIMMAIGGVAPMVAPVVGGAILTAGGTWRTVFLALTGFAVLMMVAAWFGVPETLAPERRHAGGLRAFGQSFRYVLGIRPFVGYMLTNAASGFAMFAYISNAPYTLMSIKGMAAMHYAIFFGATSVGSVVTNLVNSRIVVRFGAERLIRFGLTCATLAVVGLTLGVLFWHTPLVLTMVCFVVLVASQAFVFGNAGALASGCATEMAGSASAVLGLVQSLVSAVAAPLATMGGARTALPMVVVMVVGVSGAWAMLTLVAQRGRRAAVA